MSNKTLRELEEAIAAFDEEHGTNSDEPTKEGIDSGDGANVNDSGFIPLTQDNLIGERLEISVEKVPDGRIATKIDLPSTRGIAMLLLLGAIQAMAKAGNETLESVLQDVVELYNHDVLHSPISLD